MVKEKVFVKAKMFDETFLEKCFKLANTTKQTDNFSVASENKLFEIVGFPINLLIVSDKGRHEKYFRWTDELELADILEKTFADANISAETELYFPRINGFVQSMFE